MRLQFEVGDDTVKFLDSLTATLGLNSRAEALRNALSLLDWAAEEAKAGNRVGAYDETSKTFREVLLLPLRTLRSDAIRTREVEGSGASVKPPDEERGTPTDEARHEDLRRQAEALVERGKVIVARQKLEEQLAAAFDAGKQAYREEKAKQR